MLDNELDEIFLQEMGLASITPVSSASKKGIEHLKLDDYYSKADFWPCTDYDEFILKKTKIHEDYDALQFEMLPIVEEYIETVNNLIVSYERAKSKTYIQVESKTEVEATLITLENSFFVNLMSAISRFFKSIILHVEKLIAKIKSLLIQSGETWLRKNKTKLLSLQFSGEITVKTFENLYTNSINGQLKRLKFIFLKRLGINGLKSLFQKGSTIINIGKGIRKDIEQNLMKELGLPEDTNLSKGIRKFILGEPKEVGLTKDLINNCVNFMEIIHKNDSSLTDAITLLRNGQKTLEGVIKTQLSKDISAQEKEEIKALARALPSLLGTISLTITNSVSASYNRAFSICKKGLATGKA